ncbi:hypothetical protein AVEN_36255-1 [Araneus ventricosus]|uniref:Tudor domain-containing protein n=1 Tax=Araneus ventricosus TaxID=182803 RepID=A0A4Y2K9N8_ARAVE|nr:hypothetical protein AVEN_36255-1 [Araneus ventricosus]
MVKLRQYSGGSEDQAPNHNMSCSAEAALDALKMNGSVCETLYVNVNCSVKVPTKESSFPNGNCNNVPAKVNMLVSENSSNKMSVNETSAVNGHSDTMSAINGHSDMISAVNGRNDTMSAINGNKVLISDVPTVNGNCVDEVPAEEVPVVNGLNGSNTPSENDSCSNAHTSDSLCNEDNSNENQHGFIEVVNKKKRNKNRNKNHRKKRISNLPPGLNTESIRRDNGIDKNCGEKSSSTHLSPKLPSKNFAAIRSSEKSYSSVLVNGQNGNSLLRNGRPNISSDSQNVTKRTESKHMNNINLPGTCISVDQLSADLTKSVINDTSAIPCKQSNLSTKVEMTDVSAQTDVCSQDETSASQKECLSSHEEVIHESEKASSPSDYGVDVGEISDESSTAAYCDSVDSNDSGRGDSEITNDAKSEYYEFPKEKTSQLIGRSGSFRYEIERMSGIKLWVYPHVCDKDLSIISMTGTGAQIEKAKELIKARFPHVTLTQWLGFEPVNPPLSEKYLPILPESTDFMGVVSCICDPNFFWVQQYGHPQMYSLEGLERKMSDHFNTVTDAPGIDNPTIGSVVAVPGVRDGDNVRWIRGEIINIIPGEENIVVRYLDHGGDHLVPVSNIRPMRHDFFSMPFFAAQCCLYDVFPTGGVWSAEALAEFTRLCNGSTFPPIVRVVYKTPDCYFVTMFGYDPEIGTEVNIASRLVTKGFGVRPCIPATEFPSELQQ